jgi:hypothetical protein
MPARTSMLATSVAPVKSSAMTPRMMPGFIGILRAGAPQCATLRGDRPARWVAESSDDHTNPTCAGFEGNP